MIELLAAAGESHWTWTLFGRFHPLVVHFPIALLVVASLVEVWGMIRRRTAAGDTAWICVGLGTIVGTIMGYSFAESQGAGGKDLELHERLGLLTTIASFITAVLCWRARRMGGVGGPAMAFRAFLFLSTLGVGATGHFGGEMVYPGWLVNGMPWEAKAPLQNPAPPEKGTSTPVAGTVDFEKQIAPIIKASCLKCHNPNKAKAKLRLDSKALALKGGSGGKCIVPGKPDDSTFYTLLISTDSEERMPSEADPLPKEQTELIKKWIEQGAPWPDGVEIK
jgi:uncharacterized membrane protein